ncbi:putative transcription factor interactor and regulator LisH family [Helianthus debilis subsp. tardiflorus]
MDDYTREMMDLKTLVTRTLEKKGVLAKIRGFELASDDIVDVVLRVKIERRLLTALICEYLDWAQLGHTLKVYLPECNLIENRKTLLCVVKHPFTKP